MASATDLTRRQALLAGGAGVVVLAAGVAPWALAAPPARFPLVRADSEWRRQLSPAAYSVLRRQATERAGSSPLNNEHRRGVYRCAGCSNEVFRSEAKFESGTGWPSFTAPIRGAIGTRSDNGLFGARTEVHCARCGGHLGHVFPDGTPPTGRRYCMNGVALVFRPT